MIAEFALVFVIGMTIGLTIGLLIGYKVWRTFIKPIITLPSLAVNTATCASGQLTMTVQPGANTTGLTLTAYYAKAYNSVPPPLASNPITEGATRCLAGTPVSCPALTGNMGQYSVVVWAEYADWSKAWKPYTCGSSTGPMISVIPNMAPPELDAVPRAYRVALGPARDGSVRGPEAELVGALGRAPETVLRYVPEESSPSEPLWRALGGTDAIHEAALRLMHRTGGTGALLRAALVVAGQRVELVWVTSDWRAHGPSRFVCESDEPGVPALVVTPA